MKWEVCKVVAFVDTEQRTIRVDKNAPVSPPELCDDWDAAYKRWTSDVLRIGCVLEATLEERGEILREMIRAFGRAKQNEACCCTITPLGGQLSVVVTLMPEGRVGTITEVAEPMLMMFVTEEAGKRPDGRESRPWRN